MPLSTFKFWSWSKDDLGAARFFWISGESWIEVSFERSILRLQDLVQVAENCNFTKPIHSQLGGLVFVKYASPFWFVLLCRFFEICILTWQISALMHCSGSALGRWWSTVMGPTWQQRRSTAESFANGYWIVPIMRAIGLFLQRLISEFSGSGWKEGSNHPSMNV